MTWKWEMTLVAGILSLIVIITQGSWIEWIGSLAVLLTFGHVQVADRLAESQEKSEATVHCYRWARRYLISKEICWLVYFIVLGAYSALVGVFLFLLYPFWRMA